MVTIMWDTPLKEEHQSEGLELIRRIWSDMKQFAGYLGHETLIDHDLPGRVVIVSRWTSREAADQTVTAYAGSEPVRLLSPLLAGPRKRSVFRTDGCLDE